MHFPAMALIGMFKLSSQEHQYVLIYIDMLMNYTWCIWLFTKEADKVVHAYLVNVYSKFGGLYKILSDNSTEFRNKLLTQVASILEMKQLFSSPYYAQGNGCIENVHDFLKMCIQKHVSSELALDEVVHITCASYNFVCST